MTSADLAHLMIRLTHQLQDGLRQHLHRSGRCLLHKDVAVIAVLEGVQDQFDCVVQRHHEPGHGWVRHGDWLACEHLLNKQRNDRTTRRHDVAVAGAANDGARAFEIPAGGNHHLFHHSFANSHSVNGIDGLIGAETYDALYARRNCRF
ncbi:hypothetical protein D9M72_230290 [compost metagenome]